MKVLLICAIFCVTWRISTLQPIVKRQVYDYDEGDDDDSNEQESDDELVVPAIESITTVSHSGYTGPPIPPKVTYSCRYPERYILHGKKCYLKSFHATPIKKKLSSQNPPNPPCPYGSYLIGNSCHPYNGKNTQNPLIYGRIVQNPPYGQTGHIIQNPPYNPYNSQTSQIIPFPYSPPPPICPPGYQFSGGMCYYIYTSYNPYNSYTIYSG